MENAVDALKIGFAMLVFVMALSIAIYALGEARETSDIVIAQTDRSEERRVGKDCSEP